MGACGTEQHEQPLREGGWLMIEDEVWPGQGVEQHLGRVVAR
jgi:hypothetical protein